MSHGPDLAAVRPRLVGLNHVALEVGNVEEALAFYGRIFSFTLRGRQPQAAFIDLGDQFIALMEGPLRAERGHRHFGLVVADRSAVRTLAAEAGAELLDGPFLDFLDPWGNRIEIVDYSDIQFTKAPHVLRGMGLELSKSDKAQRELAEKRNGSRGVTLSCRSRERDLRRDRRSNERLPNIDHEVSAKLKGSRPGSRPPPIGKPTSPRHQDVIMSASHSCLEKGLVEVKCGTRDSVPTEMLQHPLPSRPPEPLSHRWVVGEVVDRLGQRGGKDVRVLRSKVPGSSLGSTSNPVSPGTTTSGMPPTLDATTAVSQAIASKLMMPNGS